MSLPQHLTQKPSTLCSNVLLPRRDVVVEHRRTERVARSQFSSRTASAPFAWRILSSYSMARVLLKPVPTKNSWLNAGRMPNSTAFKRLLIVDDIKLSDL